MNRFFSLLLFSITFTLSLLSSAQAEIPVQVRSNDNNTMTQGLIAALTAIIERHPGYRVTNDTSGLHVVVSVTAHSSGDSVALGANLELRPPNGIMGVGARSYMVLTNMTEAPAMIYALYGKLLIEDKMVAKLNYIRARPVAPGDLNEVCRLMLAAKSAAHGGGN